MLFAPAIPLLFGALVPPVQDDFRPQQPVLPHFDDTRHAPPVLDAGRYAVEMPRPGAPLSTAAGSNSALPAPTSGIARTIAHVHVDCPTGGDWWARGATYKARFGADGVEYIPFLGSKAPQNYPVGLRLLSASAAGQSLTLAQDVDAKHSGDAMSFERGPLTERYLLSLESVEQTFVFHDAVAGELSVRVGLDTELAALESEDGLAFGNELGSVHLSEAFAVDANGSRLALTTSFDGESYEIVVPADFVAAAAFPLTIDPIISTFAIDTFSASLTSPRSAYDPGTATFLVVYNENFSSADSDVYSVQTSISGSAGFGGYFDLTSDRCFTPDAGCARSNNAILVASVADTGTGTNSIVRGRIFTPSTSSYGTAFQIDSGVNTGPFHDVCVGGDPFDRFLVVWNREWSSSDRDVFARVVLASGALVGTSNITIDNSSADFNNVKCSKHNGSHDVNTSAWALAMQFTGATQEIWTARIQWDGTVLQTPTSVYAASTDDSIFPNVSSPLEQAGPRTYMITFCRDFGTDFDLFGAIVQDGAVTNITNLSFAGLAGATAFDDEFYAPIDSNGLRFVIGWRDGNLGGFDTTYVSTINLVAGGLCVTENSVIDNTGRLYPYGVTAEVDPLALGPDYLIVNEDETVTGNEDIYGTHYNDYWGCVGLQYCNAVANSTGFAGRIYGEGSGVAGDNLLLYANRLPLNQFGYFLVSRTAGFAQPPGSQGNLCLSGNIGRYNNLIQNSGPGGHFWINIDTGDVPLNPNVGVLSGETLRFTAWYRDLNPGATSNFTDGLQVTFL